MTTNPKTLKRQLAQRERFISQMLTLLAKGPMYRADLARAMAVSYGTLQAIVRYARINGWIVSQGKYYINPHNVFVADGKVIRTNKMEAVND